MDLVLLDGWKDLCLPVLKLLELRNGYESVTFPVEDGMGISCRL